MSAYDISREPVREEFDDETIDLREYWRIVYSRKWSIIGIALLFVLVAVLVVFKQRPVYQATASLLIEPESTKIVQIEDVYAVTGDDAYYRTQVEILKSRALAARVIDKLSLAEHPEFQPEEDQGGLSFKLNFNWRDWFAAWLPAMDEGVSDPEAEALAAREALIDDFLERLKVTPVRNTRFVRISFEAHDPALAARIANTLADTYIESDLDARLEMTKKATAWLASRLEELKKKLRDSEQALQAYREKERLVDSGGVGTLTAEQLQDLRQKLVTAQQERIRAQAVVNQVRAARGDLDKLASIPAVLNDPVVSSLKAAEVDAERHLKTLAKRYGAKHPKMAEARADLQEARAAVRKRIRSVIAGLEKEYQVALTNERAIRASLENAKGEMQSIHRKSYQLNVLEREVESNRQLYELFLKRLKETSETGDLQKANARIADPAVVPVVPVKPKKGQIVGIAGVLGLLFGIGLAFLLERLDNTFKRASDVEERLGLPLLGVVPHLKLGKNESPLDYARAHAQSLFSESIRTIRTSVLLSGLDEPYKVIVVTSSVPGEGKSTLAMNLADSLGDMHKVLLIDADLRRPTVATTWGLDRKAMGLSEFLSQSAKPSECVHQLGERSVYVMPSGVVPPNPLELLSSRRFKEALDTLGRTFDHIIIDSAPALAVSDALVLSRNASGVIYVVKADSTPYPAAQEGVKRLRQHKAHLIGAVLNEVPQKKKKGYGYYDSYGGSYYGSYGYTQD
jgi:capsular exopolysaccharide synthesis family protein